MLLLAKCRYQLPARPVVEVCDLCDLVMKLRRVAAAQTAHVCTCYYSPRGATRAHRRRLVLLGWLGWPTAGMGVWRRCVGAPFPGSWVAVEASMKEAR